MTTRTFALIFGIVYLGVGILGFLPGITSPPPADAPQLAVHTGYGYLLGLFPINLLHNLVHLALGAWGIVAYSSFPAARTYARGLTIIYGLLALMGLFPGLNTVFGLVPIFSHDVWLHGLTALVALYFGWMAPVEIAARRPEATRTGRAWQDQADTHPHP
jgi:hypothetical protein